MKKAERRYQKVRNYKRRKKVVKGDKWKKKTKFYKFK